MSKEAMKLALEALENAEYGDYDKKELNKAIIALREELAREQSTAWVTAGPHTVPLVTQPAKPDFWEGYVPEPVKPAQQALDKKAENAKELGLDYEPVWGGGPTNKDYEDAMRQRRLHQLTSPPAQRTWVGLSKEDKWEIVQATERDDRGYVMALVEARLKELNT
jgi:hypothetical protein